MFIRLKYYSVGQGEEWLTEKINVSGRNNCTYFFCNGK